MAFDVDEEGDVLVVLTGFDEDVAAAARGAAGAGVFLVDVVEVVEVCEVGEGGEESAAEVAEEARLQQEVFDEVVVGGRSVVAAHGRTMRGGAAKRKRNAASKQVRVIRKTQGESFR